VTVDDCVPKDLYLCVHDQCSRTVVSVKAKLHLMLRPYYIQLHPHIFLPVSLSAVINTIYTLMYWHPFRFCQTLISVGPHISDRFGIAYQLTCDHLPLF